MLTAGHRTSPQNAAIFSAIVRPELRSMVFAFDRSFEGAIAGELTPQ